VLVGENVLVGDWSEGGGLTADDRVSGQSGWRDRAVRGEPFEGEGKLGGVSAACLLQVSFLGNVVCMLAIVYNLVHSSCTFSVLAVLVYNVVHFSCTFSVLAVLRTYVMLCLFMLYRVCCDHYSYRCFSGVSAVTRLFVHGECVWYGKDT
jgi:hypothetical protein